MNCENKFKLIFNKAPEGLAFCPYRICPIGAHSDFSLGRVSGFAIDKGIYLSFSKNSDNSFSISSLQFENLASWDLNNIPKKCGDWADYLRGASFVLNKKYKLVHGLNGVLEGELPIGGLSSSASVILVFLRALALVNDITLDERDLIDLALDAEKNYVGVSVGVLDQSCEVLSREGRLLYLDTLDNSYELISPGFGMKDFGIMIFFSGLERSLVGSAFNMRVDELRSAAYALKAFSGLPYGKHEDTNMRDVSYDIFLEYKEKLPLNWVKRAEHWFSEQDRVEKGRTAFINGDIESFGQLSFESGYSSIHNWETGSPQLISLYEILTKTKGVYGGRFSGAGFKGCCMAIVNPDYYDEIAYAVKSEYLKQFPELEGKYQSCITKSSDGLGYFL